MGMMLNDVRQPEAITGAPSQLVSPPAEIPQNPFEAAPSSALVSQDEEEAREELQQIQTEIEEHLSLIHI